jgi:hypothetical protein
MTAKKSGFRPITLTALFLLFNISGFGQLLAWQFATPVELTGQEESVKAATVHPALEVTELSRGANAKPGGGNARGFSGTFPLNETKADAKKSGAYYEFVVKIKTGNNVSLTRLNAILRRQENSAYIYRWMFSLDGRKFTELGTEDVTITDLTNNGIKQPAIDLTSVAELQNLNAKTEITFRLYAWGTTAIAKAKRGFGFGKSDKKGSNVLWLDGTVTKSEK